MVTKGFHALRYFEYLFKIPFSYLQAKRKNQQHFHIATTRHPLLKHYPDLLSSITINSSNTLSASTRKN